eukprot:gene10803-biopygen7723
MSDVGKFANFQKIPFQQPLAMVECACASPYLWSLNAMTRSIQQFVAHLYFYKNTALRGSNLRVYQFIEALERDQAFEKPEKFSTTVKDLEPKKQIQTITMPAGNRKKFPPRQPHKRP